MALPQLLDRVVPVNKFPVSHLSAPAGLTVEVLIEQLDPDLPLPAAARPGDAGVDLHARVATKLAAGQRAMIPTGSAIALPAARAGALHPPSASAAPQRITVG